MTRRYLAFDLETSKITPDGDDIQNHRPLGIACWAMAWANDDGSIETFSSGGLNILDDSYSPKMELFECALLVNKLLYAAQNGHTLLTHNGAGFDFDILAEESGMHAECAQLAMNSVDTCLMTLCYKGFPVGLNAASVGMGLSGKTAGMDGSKAPLLWAEGKYDEVLGYCAQDARTTLELALAIEKHRSLRWISKTGRLNSLPIPRLLTVSESLQLPLPDTSWMSQPISRESFVSWMGRG